MTASIKSAAKSVIALTPKHVAALNALTINPAHAPLDGLCLEELHRMGLIQPKDDGYALTPIGQRSLAEELTVA